MLYDVAIIGGGPAGYTAAERAGKKGLKTIMFEKNALGGICLNEGCIPTKTLLYSAKIFHTTKEALKYGVSCENISFNLSKIIARKDKVVRKLVACIKEKMAESGVEVIIGEAIYSFTKRQIGCEIVCNGQTYEARKVILCTGSKTIIPPIPGLKETGFWTNREALDNKDMPKSLLIIGGGVIGIEFASFFNTFGTKVIVVEMLDEILGEMDKELSALLRTELSKRGIEFYLNTKVTSVHGLQIELETADGEKRIEATRILVSTGRRPLTTGLKTNEFMQTNFPNIYACGDTTGFSLLAHTAIQEAETAIQHILGNKQPMSYKAIPSVVYTYPEIASVGKTEETLLKENIPYIVKKLPMTYSGRFVSENELGNGVCKILEAPDGTILGAHILGNPASELIVIAGAAIENGWRAENLKSVIFPHPTVGEIIKETL